MNSKELYRHLPADYYDYIIVDEFHHAAAKTYHSFLSYFKPQILLGLTATPERMDGQSVLGYFDGQIAAEIRLPEAIDRKLLCPFEYFGVSDSVDLDGLRWTNGGYADSDLDNLYVFSHETAIRRADLIIRKVLDYTTDIDAVKGLGFCVSVKHADFMAEQFMKAGIPSISLSAESSDAERDSAKTRLQRGEIKFIFVVDLYNEGDSIQGVRRRRRVMAKKVTVIPAKVDRFTAQPLSGKSKRKVCGYARVSTDHDEQLTSYEAQLGYYTNYIKAHDDWEFVGMYSDEGISGTNTKHRAGFKSMVRDAKAGKVDLILTKSVSRFARNTVNSLTTIRELKECGVEIYFEKENIWTMDSKGEVLITIMSSLAQEESRSISENVAWGKRKGMQDGKVSVNYKRFLDYGKGMQVIPEEAKIVKSIYRLYLEGLSEQAICNRLMEKGILSPGGKTTWHRTLIKSILTNEKYKGSALLQKTFTEDFLTKKHKKNNGELPQYYIEKSHEAIIAPDIFEKAQDERARRRQRTHHYSGVSSFSYKIICGECGHPFGSKVWHSNDKYRRVIWQCNQKFRDKDHRCETPHITEDEIKDAFVKALNKFIAGKDNEIADAKMAQQLLCDTSELEKQKISLENEMEIVDEAAKKLVERNARVTMDQNEFQQEYGDLETRYRKAEEQMAKVTGEIETKKRRRDELGRVISLLEEATGPVQEFSERQWGEFVDHMTVFTKTDIRVTMKDGTEIRI